MRQILQHLRTGELMIEDVPAPGVRAGHLLIQTSKTLISAGTERMLVDFGRANLLSKARQQPDKVAQVIQKIKTEGLVPTLEAIYSKLDQPIPLGYCNVGRVLAVGADVEGFAVGDRVASNGPHAEIVCVPKNLCAKIPERVSDEQATFTIIASIGLQGIRLAEPSLGERVAVFGLGLIGLLTVQMLHANGVRVIGFDFNSSRVALARRLGAQAHDLSTGLDPVAAAQCFSQDQGIDAVLITASTKSNDPVQQAASMCRKRGRIVLVGVVGLELRRSDFYEKELSFQVSCSYGPGRYDSAYEEGGQDYPLGFVRWTENRNMMAVLDLMEAGRMRFDEMIDMRVPLAEAKRAYDAVADGSGLGLILDFDSDPLKARAESEPQRSRILHLKGSPSSAALPVVAVIGAGNFTLRQVLPALKPLNARLKWISSSGGVSAAFAAKKFGFERVSTDNRVLLDDPEVQAVIITTRHNSHASWVLAALRAGKHVFVEKPLCLLPEELQQIEALYAELCAAGSAPILMVGYNRRFSPFSQLIRGELASRSQPLAATFTCNAGAIPSNHWTQDPEIGGGRILGEACHFIDLLRYYAGSPIMAVQTQLLRDPAGNADSASIGLSFQDGSIGTVHYFATGHKSVSKEYADLYFEGKIVRLDNFKSIRGFGTRKIGKKSLWSQDKGHRQGFAAFIAAVRTGAASPIPFDELLNVQRAAFAAVESLRKGGIQISGLSSP